MPLAEMLAGQPIVALPPIYPDEPQADPEPQDIRPPRWHHEWEPLAGEVYQNQKGNFMVVLGCWNGSWKYLNFSANGELMFPSQAARHYFAQRRRVGYVRLPTLMVEPLNA